MSDSKIVLEIFDKLRKANCSLNLIGEDLKLEIPKDYEIPDHEIHEIRKYKPEIVRMLQSMSEVANQEKLPPIIPFDRSKVEGIPVSYSQKRFWFVDQLEGSTHYHIPLLYELKGDFNPEAFDYAWNYIVDRYEVYRTVFKEKEGEVFQYIMDADAWNVTYIQAQEWTDEETLRWVDKELSKAFDLSKDFLLRIHVLHLSENRTGVVVIYHHITMDGWSLPIVQNEVMELYTAYDNGQKANLAPLSLQYADFANWQKSYLSGDLFKHKLKWWRDYLEGVEPTELPLDFPRPSTQSIRGANHSFVLDAELQNDLKTLSNKENATLFMILLAGLKILLYRYSGQEDICVGTPAANRTHAVLENVIGCFINSLVLRSNLGGDPCFQEVLERLRSHALTAYQHQDVPIDLIIEQVVKERDQSYRPLFQVLFVMQNLSTAEVEETPESSLGFEATPHAIKPDVTKFDISFLAEETANGILLSIEYCDELFKPETIASMANHYKQLIQSIAQNPQIPISKLSLLTPAEETRLCVDFNNTQFAYPTDKTFLDYFENQVSDKPEAVALYMNDESLSYKQLDEQANQLAHYLIKAGVSKGTRVALSLENSPGLIIGVLAVFKAGASYLPIDSDYPIDRKIFLIQDAQASFVMGKKDTLREIEHKTTHLGITCMYVDELEAELQSSSKDKPQISLSNEEVAYIIYTSGSTGKPKGVLISQASLIDYSLSFKDYFSIDSDDKVIQQSSISFDTFVEEVFPCLISGASLIILEEGGKDIKELKKSIEEKGATILSTSPVVLEWLGKSLDHTGNLRCVISGGDLLKPSQIKAFFGKVPVFNSYGPSEATVCATYHEITSLEEASIIGKPIANREIYILSKNLQLLPIGVKGEICIGGTGLAQAYLGKPELTKEKFINHPFKEAGRLYRTGDYGKWLPDGRIEFLGRGDNQVKLRGYRIELGEIEHVLREHKQVEDCVITLEGEKDNNKRLVAYIVPHATFDKTVISKQLSEKLPAYMMPSVWVELEALPMNKHDKVDKKRLPKPDLSLFEEENLLAPDSEVEHKLLAIWEELLETNSLGVNQNFFELGGHSLMAMELVFMIEKNFSVKIPVKSIFETGTVRELAKHL